MKITAGIWAFGLMVLTVAVKVCLPVLKGELSQESLAPAEPARSPALENVTAE